MECWGGTFAELLEAAAHALYAVAFRHLEDRRDSQRWITVEATGPEEAVVRWLQELIYLMEAERFAAAQFMFARADAQGVNAEVRGYRYAPDDREDEVKAATYHGMKIEQDDKGWRAEIILDL